MSSPSFSKRDREKCDLSLPQTDSSPGPRPVFDGHEIFSRWKWPDNPPIIWFITFSDKGKVPSSLFMSSGKMQPASTAQKFPQTSSFAQKWLLAALFLYFPPNLPKKIEIGNGRPSILFKDHKSCLQNEEHDILKKEAKIALHICVLICL